MAELPTDRDPVDHRCCTGQVPITKRILKTKDALHYATRPTRAHRVFTPGHIKLHKAQKEKIRPRENEPVCSVGVLASGFRILDCSLVVPFPVSALTIHTPGLGGREIVPIVELWWVLMRADCLTMDGRTNWRVIICRNIGRWPFRVDRIGLAHSTRITFSRASC